MILSFLSLFNHLGKKQTIVKYFVNYMVEKDDDADQQIKNASYTTAVFSLCTVPMSLLSVSSVC